MQQILSPEFLLLQAMPALTLALGFVALDLTFIKMRERFAKPSRGRSD